MKYKYSSGQMLIGVAKLLFLTIAFYLAIIDDKADSRSWSLFWVVLLAIIGRFIYLCISYYIPCFQSKTALEIDDEKIQFFIKAKIPLQSSRELIYWKDVQDLDFVYARLTGAVVTFKMNDGSDDSSMPLKYVAGDDKEIYNTMIAYLKR